MNRATAAAWLEANGPISSADLREKMGITVKGTPISSHLSALVNDKYAKKKKVGSVNVFTITPKGSSWIAGRPSEVETIEQINANTYTKGAKRPGPTRLPNTATEERAIEGIVGVIEENKHLRATLEGIYMQLGQALGK